MAMKITVGPDVQKLIEQRLIRGGYATPEDVILAALGALEQVERFGDFRPGELDRLLAEGEAGGEPIDGDEALTARRKRRQERRGADRRSGAA
jgi:Arc/MetJ-type ribon-helix-helix transcriptional regulator